MSIGKQEESQGTLRLSHDQLPKSLGHAFYDHLQRILLKVAFDRFAEEPCEPYYAKGKGRPSIPLGRYFRMLLVGYFKEIDSERGMCWRCADSLSLRKFLRLDIGQSVPDHSSLSRIRSRLALEVHHEVFLFVLKLLAEAKQNLKAALGKFAPKYDVPAVLAGDKGHHSRNALVLLDTSSRSRICESERGGSATGTGTRGPAGRSTTIEHVCNPLFLPFLGIQSSSLYWSKRKNRPFL